MVVDMDSRRDPRVAAVKLRHPDYESGALRDAVKTLAQLLGWDSPAGGAFARVIPPGSRVVLKPNWVLHRNDGPWGLEPLVTHQNLVEVVAAAALESDLASLIVGDAPLQRCDFKTLMAANGISDWAADVKERDPRFAGVRDFRRTTSVMDGGIRHALENQQPLSDFVLVDLKSESLLEPITDDRPAFRVTRYDPKYMAQTHRRGRHCYLVARDILEADVVINLPKLKTHRKAGITCALKNLIGINGNKEFLPHHRIGGSSDGGDCYPGRSRTKRVLEYAFDRENAARAPYSMQMWRRLTEFLSAGLRFQRDELGVDGAWWGNDTIWRTCLDLNRVLIYGRPDGTIADTPQRRVIHIADAIIAGHGDGPLAAEPLPLGMLLGSSSAAAMDFVGARILGYDPARIPITAHAFDDFMWPLTFFGSDEVTLTGDLGNGSASQLIRSDERPYAVSYPVGWVAAAEDPTAAALRADSGIPVERD